MPGVSGERETDSEADDLPSPRKTAFLRSQSQHSNDADRPGISENNYSRYHAIDLPKCHGCFRRWQYPREVSFLAGDPYDRRHGGALSEFEPITKEGIVIYQTWDRFTNESHLREDIFSRLKLTHTIQTKHRLKRLLMCGGEMDYHRLVTEFDYNRKTGDVTHCLEFFDGEQEDEYRYAQLLTLNSWYIVLLKNILSIMVDISSMATGVMMLGQLYSAKGGFREVEFVQNTKLWFAIWYYACLVAAFLRAGQSARWEWKVNSSPKVGDTVTKCGPWDRFLSFTALTVLIFLGLDKLIKDIVTILHPWKSVQPYAAVKIEGVRVHVVGYKSRPLFHVENSSGQFYVLCILGLNKIVSFIYKACIIVAVYCRGRVQTTLIISTFVSMVSATVAIHKVRRLRQQLRLFRKELLRILAFAEGKNDMSKLGPASKLLAVHFQQEYNNGKLKKVTPSKFEHADQTRCRVCGRAHVTESSPPSVPSPPPVSQI